MRLFQSEFGGQISWLLPAALISLGAMLWVSRRAVRTDRTRAAALLWGGWVLVTGLVFSFMSGIIHPYYMVALAPGIAALVGIGAMALWQARLGLAGRIAAAAGIAVTAGWAYILLNRTPTWLPWLRWVVVVAGAAAAVLVLAGPWLRARSRRGRLALAAVPLGLALVAGLAGPTAYALDTVNSAHTGAIPSAGPQTAGFGGGPGGRARRPGRIPRRPGGPSRPGWPVRRRSGRQHRHRRQCEDRNRGASGRDGSGRGRRYGEPRPAGSAAEGRAAAGSAAAGLGAVPP